MTTQSSPTPCEGEIRGDAMGGRQQFVGGRWLAYDHPEAARARGRDVPAIHTTPHNLEAEQAVLGALMFDNGAAERLPDGLRSDHFYEPLHRHLFALVEDHLKRGLLADPTTLGERMKDQPAFAELGGVRYLADLMDRAPPAAHAGDYARLVLDTATRRALIAISGEIAADAQSADLEAKEALELAEGRLFALAERGETKGGDATFGEAADLALEIAARAYQRDGGLAGLSTGLIDVDQKLGGLHPSDLLVLAGRPSMGKTALATNIAFSAAKAYRAERTPDGQRKTVSGGVVQFFSLEMSKEQLATRILADVADVSSDRIRRGDISREEFARLSEARDTLRQIPLRIDDTGGLNIGKLCARARRQKRRPEGLDLIVVDYLQLVTTTGGKGGNRVQEVSEITMALKALAKELAVPVIALSQLSRQVESREDKRPQLSDLRESGSIEQDADVVMFVYREAYYLGRAEPKPGTDEHFKWSDEMSAVQGKAEVIIGKQRHGPIGTIKLAFNENTTRFSNLARDDRYPAANVARYSAQEVAA